MEIKDEIFIRGMKHCDCMSIASLLSATFSEEARSTGMPIRKWRDIKTEELLCSPSKWPQCGVALCRDKVIGAILTTVDDEPDSALSYWALNRRAGCLPTIFTMLYDQVLEDALAPHECLIDFLAVSPEARGKGVGAALLQWAEQNALKILSQRAPESVKEHGNGISMMLWVAADNINAYRLYAKQGYEDIEKTDETVYACCSSCIFKRFLGHPLWIRMQKTVLLMTPLPNKNGRAIDTNNNAILHIDESSLQ